MSPEGFIKEQMCSFAVIHLQKPPDTSWTHGINFNSKPRTEQELLRRNDKEQIYLEDDIS
jgi:hypothetical protein